MIPFEFPVFNSNHEYSSLEFTDPMDTKYVQHDLKINHREVLKTKPCKSKNYTFLEDTQNHRDEITSMLSRKHNRIKYSSIF